MPYQSPAQDAHMRDEEQQWARVLSRGDAARGMALVYVQKFCTAVHEFEPAWRAGALGEEALEHVRARLLARLDYCLEVMDRNGLGLVPGAPGLRDLRRRVQEAPSMEALMDLADTIHAANHIVCEALEA